MNVLFSLSLSLSLSHTHTFRFRLFDERVSMRLVGVTGWNVIGLVLLRTSKPFWKVQQKRKKNIRKLTIWWQYTNCADNEAPSFRAYCGYQLGISYLMLDDIENARRVLEKVPSWVRKVRIMIIQSFSIQFNQFNSVQFKVVWFDVRNWFDVLLSSMNNWLWTLTVLESKCIIWMMLISLRVTLTISLLHAKPKNIWLTVSHSSKNDLLLLL
jgi:hypothetical protein